MATVVVFLASTPAVSSTGRPTSLSVSSVCSGLISLTAPTSVVLPTPKPPATRILSVTGSAAGWWRRSERPKTIDHLAQNALVRQLCRRDGPGDADEFRVE